MFSRLDNGATETVEFEFDGQSFVAQIGDSIAVALLAAGQNSLRDTPVSGAARGPFCLMGACFDCLVEIDGETRQACMTPVRAGMVVARMRPVGEGAGE